MSNFGKILWQDLTVDDATAVKDFYCAVVGWTSEDVKVGDHVDYNIINPKDNNKVVAGICHRMGPNSKLPPQWLNYVYVEDMDASLERCTAMGGEIVDGPKLMGKQKFAVIKDPAGAHLAIMQE